MMITYIYGDLFYSPAKVLVNPVNTVGTMSSGLAYEFKRFFPDMYESYRELCQNDEFAIGQLMLYRTPHKWILNFPTKKHYRAASSIEYIEQGLQKFARIYADMGITSISFPQIGTGDDGLEWSEVRPVLEAFLSPLPLSIFIHLPSNDAPTDTTSTRAMRKWLNGQPQQVTFDSFWTMLLDVVRNNKIFQTDDEFRVLATEAKGRQRLSLKISPKYGDSIFIPETQLRDLWQYVSRAGYVIPHNLPAGLEEHADYIVVLLSHLPLLRPIQLAPDNGTQMTGLHYIPPTITDTTETVVSLAAEQ